MGVFENVSKTLAEGSTIEQPQENVNDSECVLESLENGARVCSSGKEDEMKYGLADVTVNKSVAVADKNEVVEDGSVAVSMIEKKDADISAAVVEGGNLDDSVINGVSSLLRMKEDKRGIKMDDDAGVDKVKVPGSVMGSIDVNDEKGAGIGDGDQARRDDTIIAGETNGVMPDLYAEKMDSASAKDGVGLNADAITKDGGDAGMAVGNTHVSETEINDAEEEDFEDVGHGFSVGDFVWGKIKNHPWWPGQIYDPSNASENALKIKAKGKLLVAYFGDGTFAWCYPSQLKPFEENFEEMAKQSSSNNFLKAVQAALDEIGKLVNYRMTSFCVPDERRAGVIRPVVENAGIEGGVFVPDAGVWKLSVIGMEPAWLLTNLKATAQGASTYSALVITLMKGLLSAFYCFRGGYELPQYHEPDLIAGLEDKRENATGSIAVEVPNQCPEEEELLSSFCVKQKLRKCPSMSGRKKVKSIVEILGVNKDVKTPDNSSWTGATTAPGKKKKKGAGDENCSKAGSEKQTTRDVTGSLDGLPTEGVNAEIENAAEVENKEKKGRRRKKTTVADGGADGKEKNKQSELPNESVKKAGQRKQLSSNVNGSPVGPYNGDRNTKIDDSSAEGKGENKGKSWRHRKKITVEDGKEGDEEENKRSELQGNNKTPDRKSSVSGIEDQPPGARERKKSKYLSPPYTSIAKGQRKKEIEAESLKVSSIVRLGERMKNAASSLVSGTPSPKSESVVSQKRSKARDGEIQKGISSETLKTKDKDVDPMKVKAPSHVVLCKIQSVALSHFEKWRNNEVEEFMRAFRYSVYHDGSNGASGQSRRKQKSHNSGLEGEKETELVSTPPDLASRNERPKKRKESGVGTQEILLESTGEKQTQPISVSTNLTSQKKRAKLSKKSDVGALGSPERATKRKMSHSGVSNAPESKPQRKKNKSNEDLDASKGMPDTEALGATRTAPKHELVSQTPKGKKQGSACLLVTFGSGSSLPAKENIMEVYRKFGVVSEDETAVYSNNSCAIVVFKKASDAEAALKSSLNENLFGAPNVTFELHYQSAVPEAQTPDEDTSTKKDLSAVKGNKKGKTPEKQSAPQTTGRDTSDVPFIKRKLEKMIGMLEKADGKLSKKMKTKLEGEMKRILEKLSMTGQSALT